MSLRGVSLIYWYMNQLIRASLLATLVRSLGMTSKSGAINNETFGLTLSPVLIRVFNRCFAIGGNELSIAFPEKGFIAAEKDILCNSC